MTIDTSFVHHCPPWALPIYTLKDPDPDAPDSWRPLWNPIRGNCPMPGFERFVADLLTELGITWVYEPLTIPLPRCAKVPDPFLKHERKVRLVRNDFYLPDQELIIEIYSGESKDSRNRKSRRLIRMFELYRIPFLLLTTEEWNQLLSELEDLRPQLLFGWIQESLRAHTTAA